MIQVRTATAILIVSVLFACGPSAQHTTPTEVRRVEKSTMATPNEELSIQMLCARNSRLLTRFPLEELFGNPLPKLCCSEGVLPAEHHHCVSDWPSGDVPSCGLWQEMAEALTALLSTPPAWLSPKERELAIQNRDLLLDWFTQKRSCLAAEIETPKWLRSSPNDAACPLDWLAEKLAHIGKKDTTTERCAAATLALKPKLSACYDVLGSALSDSRTTQADKRRIRKLVDSLLKLSGRLNRGAGAEANLWYTYLTSFWSGRYRGCDGADCLQRLSGERPTGVLRVACAVFDVLGDRQMTEFIASMGLEGHALGGCHRYLVRHGLWSEKVRNFIAAEVQGRPGQRLRQYLIEEGVGVLPHVLAFAQGGSHAYGEPSQGPCVSMLILDGLEARGLIQTHVVASADLSCAALTEARLERLTHLNTSAAEPAHCDGPEPQSAVCGKAVEHTVYDHYTRAVCPSP